LKNVSNVTTPKNSLVACDWIPASNILKGGDSGAAMIPGEPAASRLIQAIRYDGDLQMPPEKPLGDDQKKLLTHWIELGAPVAGRFQTNAVRESGSFKNSLGLSTGSTF
jgi:hypothetical protein